MAGGEQRLELVEQTTVTAKSFLLEDSGAVLTPHRLDAEEKNMAADEAPVVNDELDLIDVSDVPLPPTEIRTEVADEMKSATAFKWAVIGAGQGGGRLALQFWSMGYRRVVAVNTAGADLQPLALPGSNKLKIGVEGAGGIIEAGAKACSEHREDIHNMLRRCWGTDFDRALITVTAGGGTGAGGVFELINVVGEYMDKEELRSGGDPKVGVIVALPKESDGKRAHANAYRTFKKLLELAPDTISPLIVIDNQRINRLYPGMSVSTFWDKANRSVCSIFHLLNVVAAKSSEYTSFDKADLEVVLQSGLLAFGATPVANWSEPDSISVAIRDNLKRNVLVSDLDLSTGLVAGCVIIAGPDTLQAMTQEALDDGFSMLGRMLRDGNAIYRGIYAGNSKQPVVYTMIGGLDAPKGKLEALRKAGGL